MKSVIVRRYTGTQIVYTSAIAALNLKLVFKNIRVCTTLEKYLKRDFWVLRRYIFFYFVQWAALDKFGMFDLFLS